MGMSFSTRRTTCSPRSNHFSHREPTMVYLSNSRNSEVIRTYAIFSVGFLIICALKNTLDGKNHKLTCCKQRISSELLWTNKHNM